MFQRILVAIDHTHLSEPVFAHALELAQAYGASLKLFHCLATNAMREAAMPSVPSEVGQYPGLVDNLYWNQPIDLQGQPQAQALLENYSNIATSQGVSTVFEYQVGDPSQWLCQVARGWSADLIVLGRRGNEGLVKALLGSISDYVVDHAPCSVLVIQAVQAS